MNTASTPDFSEHYKTIEGKAHAPYEITATFLLTTPAFVRGNHNKATLKVSSIKGVLRYWWRALHYWKIYSNRSEADVGKKKKNTLGELAKAENDLWGSTEQSGQVHMRLTNVPLHASNQPIPSSSCETIGTLIDPISYGLGQGIVSSKHKSSYLSEYLKQGQTFTMTFALPNTAHPQHEQHIHALLLTIAALGRYGAIGGRSKNGFGGLTLQHLSSSQASISVDKVNALLDQHETALECQYVTASQTECDITSKHTSLDVSELPIIPALSPFTKIFVPSGAKTYPTFNQALTHILTHYQNVRRLCFAFNSSQMRWVLTQSPKTNPSVPTPTKVYLGLPLAWRDTKTSNTLNIRAEHYSKANIQRRASQLLLGVGFNDNDYFPKMLLLASEYLPETVGSSKEYSSSKGDLSSKGLLVQKKQNPFGNFPLENKASLKVNQQIFNEIQQRLK